MTTRTVEFTVLGDWSPVGYVNQFVWIAFPERLVATGERHGPDNHAGVWPVEQFLSHWSSRLAERGWDWMAPLIERLASGENPDAVEADALDDYVLRYGAPPRIQGWNLDPEAYLDGGA